MTALRLNSAKMSNTLPRATWALFTDSTGISTQNGWRFDGAAWVVEVGELLRRAGELRTLPLYYGL
jgi:hypothetical protein